MRRFLRYNGLSLVLLVVFLTAMGGQFATGRRQYNEERREQGEPAALVREYLASGHFWEATTENWESEFFQMAMFVLLTVKLYQKGSAESNDPDHPPSLVGRAHRRNTHAPSPVRRGGWRLRVYEHSLSLALLLLFFGAFTGHVVSGATRYNEERKRDGEPAVTRWEYLRSSRFWFESFQNWQSEFLAIGTMVVLTVFLRERGSPESKAVETPHGAHEG